MNTNQIINSAIQFEIISIKSKHFGRNPHCNEIMQMQNGEALWEAVNVAVELYFDNRKQYDELERFANRVCEGYDNLKQIIERQSIEIDNLKQQLFEGKDNPEDDLPF